MRKAVRMGSRRHAFSLIEVVLAVGVMSFALVGILGLFPVALNAARDSQQETQAALIARMIYNDLSALPANATFIATSTNSFDDPAGRIDVNLAEAATYHLAINADGLPDGAISEGEFDSGKNDSSMVAKIAVTPQAAPADTTVSQLEILIQAPGAAPKDRRTSYGFATLVPNQPSIP